MRTAAVRLDEVVRADQAGVASGRPEREQTSVRPRVSAKACALSFWGHVVKTTKRQCISASGNARQAVPWHAITVGSLSFPAKAFNAAP